ncbi:MAG: hypothetical protein Q8P10_00970 [bacterium]|nr:hypothetical protein [bacterium]
MKQSGFYYFFKKIWPTVYHIINGLLYFILSLIKDIIKFAIQQIKGEI